jgi:7-cyano-7-deazaguanine synthase
VSQHDSVAVFSGGMDSTTLVYDMLQRGYTPHLLSFNYGQRHAKELGHAKAIAELLGLRHDVVDLTGLTHLISNSALTSQTTGWEIYDRDEIEVPEGHYAEDNMKQTVVPNRNMIMLSIAAGVAVNNNYRAIATGVHAGDHFVYPDCRPRFIMATAAAIMIGNEGFGRVPKLEPGTDPGEAFLIAPYLDQSKADIAYRALELDVPLHLTWSCYKGGDKHCGKCGTCVERLEAIDIATIKFNEAHPQQSEFALQFDETEYEDTSFWKEAIRNA